MNIYPDWTLLIQLAFFGACYWMLKTLVFPPVLNIIRKRQKMVEHAQKELVEREEEGREMERKYAAEIRDIRMEAQQIRNQARQEAGAYEREQLAQQRADALAKQQQKHTEMAATEQRLLAGLRQEKQKLGREVVSSLLGRPLSS
ncbi:MAG: ATP synthase F0 subunit B [Myxococcota bacterium]